MSLLVYALYAAAFMVAVWLSVVGLVAFLIIVWAVSGAFIEWRASRRYRRKYAEHDARQARMTTHTVEVEMRRMESASHLPPHRGDDTH